MFYTKITGTFLRIDKIQDGLVEFRNWEETLEIVGFQKPKPAYFFIFAAYRTVIVRRNNEAICQLKSRAFRICFIRAFVSGQTHSVRPVCFSFAWEKEHTKACYTIKSN